VPSDDLPPAPDSPVRESPTPTDKSPPVQESQPTTDQSPSADDQSTPDREDQPDLDELRKQLNEQFESIRVLAPGQYELNLMELYDREEYIIALQEDGKYTIQVPERWKD
jgi:predicted  nucleic acid-binding Zn-ribbon protein